MISITYIGMDVHTTNYTLSAFTLQGQTPFAEIEIKPEIGELVNYLTNLNRNLGGGCNFVCGYEAGCLGYSLYHEINSYKWKGFTVECVIMAPSTMAVSPKDKLRKNDREDARRIASCLCFGQYKKVYVPTEEDNAVKEYIRMRDDAQTAFKQTKQQILAMCIRHGYKFNGKTYWTAKHIRWLESLHFPNALLQETLNEYLITFRYLSEKLERFEKKIMELAQGDSYAQRTSQLSCIRGIASYTALSMVVEISDFTRFPTAEHFAAFLGLIPKDHSSGRDHNSGSITKAGNTHLRKLLIESASHYGRGTVGKKSYALKKRQEGNSPEVIAYADRAFDRLHKKYLRMILKGKPANVAKTAVARELACFIWGMMTTHIT